MSKEQIGIKAAYISIVGNSAIAIVKWITGYYGNSYALIADAIESTADIFSSILVLVGFKYAMRPADSNHPYGHGKAESLISFLIVGFLVGSATLIAYKSVENIRTPHNLPKPYTLIILGVIIIVKEIFYRITVKKSQAIQSTSLKADAWHHRSDAITSLTAFIGILIALMLGKGYEAADDWAALLASGVIMYNGYLIFRPALGEIMDENLYEDLIVDIKARSKKVEGVRDVEKCFVRKTGLTYYVDMHVAVDSQNNVRQGHDIAHRLKDRLREELPQLADILIHIEPYGDRS